MPECPPGSIVSEGGFETDHFATSLEFELTFSEVSSAFITLSAERVDQRIDQCLRRLVETAGTDRASISEIVNSSKDLAVTHRWDRPGNPITRTVMVRDMFPWSCERVLQGELTAISSPEDLPRAAEAEIEYMRNLGMKSRLVVPLMIGRAVIGSLATSTFRDFVKWDAEVIEWFQRIGEVFANAVSRKHDEAALRIATAKIRELKERLDKTNAYVRKETRLDSNHDAVIGQSAAIRSVLRNAEQVAPTDTAVLLVGDTGTGKELIAKTIHELSPRRDRAMVKVNCAAMPTTLIESELFGREKGAYTGALSREIGRFELADRSTIFLDEVGELPLELQAKLLRVLQEGEFERLGSSRTWKVDVRVIAATNRDLRAAIKEGAFREDLFYRLNVFPITIPPLRERLDDLPALVWHLLKDLCKRMGRDVERIDPATLKAFQSYAWPGNVRELRNVIERYLILNPGPVFRAEVPEADDSIQIPGEHLELIERRHMLQVLQNTRWRIRGKGGAGEILGIKPTTLEARMKKLGISRPQ